MRMRMRYKRLDAAKDELRLLEFLPTKDDSHFHFRLRHFSLNTAPKFWALSYCWGDTTGSARIILDGHNFDIRKNLLDALRSINGNINEDAYKSELVGLGRNIRYLWIDAICINQEDLDERAQQILRMQRIYQIGLVYVHLNIEVELADPAIRVIRAFDKSVKSGKEIVSDQAWRSLALLFSNPWFTRMWVIQEFVVANAKSCVIFVDSFPLRPSKMFLAAFALQSMAGVPLPPSELIAMRSGMKQFIAMFDPKLVDHKPNLPRTLSYLLWSFRDRKATDPRDKVYALLGMVEALCNGSGADGRDLLQTPSMPEMQQVIFDYRAPVEDVYASVVKMIITTTKSLNVICACQTRSQFKRSWVPDWSVPWSSTSLVVDNIYAFSAAQATARYHASGDRDLMASSVSRDSPTIEVAGLLWCHILQVANGSAADTGGSYLDWLWNIQKNLSKDVIEKTHQVYGENSNQIENALVMAIAGALKYPLSLRNNRKWLYYFPSVAEKLNGYRNIDVDENIDAIKDLEDRDFESLINASMTELMQGRKPFISNRGYCGPVPEHVEEGDCICVPFGCDVPVILLKCNDFYVFIGECYVQGLMDGEAIKAEEAGEIKSRIFEIR
ncbi:heterokaryon incompatibility -domain-containing protein [Rutstroemia sp. NJR-2017a WRK4]|nr:heterokaryon incompatibility -domain-containing protein [Rutstroemia sp. NJR-2017a WRK4]